MKRRHSETVPGHALPSLYLVKRQTNGEHLFRNYSSLLQIFSEILQRCYVVGIATGYGLYDRGVADRVPVESRLLFSLSSSDRFWGPPNFLSNGYRGFFRQGKAAEV
jgi:hypothetical protein